MSVEIIGLEGILAQFNELADEGAFVQAMQDACDLVEGTAKDNAPKDTGALRRSITNKVTNGNGSIEGVVYTPLEYAPYVEYGTGLFAEGGNGRQNVPWAFKDDKGEWQHTKGQEPHPFLRTALNEKRKQILTIFKNSIKGG